MPERVALQPRLAETVDAGDHLRHHVYYHSEASLEIPAYLLVPKDLPRRRPAIIAAHGHVDRGKEEVAGLERVYYAPTDYGLFYARQGFVVLCPDNRGWSELSLNPPEATPCDRLIADYGLSGRVLQGLRVWDLMRGVDFLQSRPEVLPNAVGAIGLSLGGELAWYLAGLDPRVKAVICLDILRPLRQELKLTSHCPCSYVPGLFAAFRDYDEPAALVAPKPLLLQTNIASPLYVQHVASYEWLKEVYSLLGKEDRLAHEAFPGEHQFFAQGLATEWFQRWLGTPEVF